MRFAQGVRREIRLDCRLQFVGVALACNREAWEIGLNIAEAAKYLFVSRPHVRLLLERGKITGTRSENGDYVIDDASVEKYAADRKRAAREYFDSQTEDNDPLGL